MMRYLLERLAPSKEIPRRKQNECTSRMSRIGLVIALCLTQSALAAPQNVPGAAPLGVDAQKCTALTELSLKTAPGGPAVVTSAQFMEVPASGLETPFFDPSGY
jgi:hypothetical protein